MTVISVMGLSAQAQTQGDAMPNPAIPLSAEVRHGVLPNGLNYYIMHNEEPKNRVNFYIAQKVGSTLENQDQLGLAHFLEHMAFNGTKHYPGKNMLNYLQSKGIRFGADINAYTGFDETVYNINNVPANDQALMDSVLLVLSDWSGSILLEEDEINSERGVIEEEWRSRSGAQSRMFDAILPIIYKEYQYQQMPIGKMEIVRNFPPKAIRDYYHKWYRPDQQGIVIVGDMDVDAMEAKVKDLFAKIPMPENAAPREYPVVSDNDKPIFAQFADKEMPYAMITVAFKSDQIPTEMRNTVMAYMQENVVQALIETMINNRLKEFSKKPECDYAFASVSFGNYFISKTKAAFDVTIIAKNEIKAAYEDALAIVAQACKTGFMQSELVRARDEILANYEKAYNERKSTKNDDIARKIIRTFIDNVPYPGAEKEFEIMKQTLMMIPVQAVNQPAATLLTPNNQVIVVARPEKEGMQMIAEDVVVGDIQRILNAEYQAYVDEELPASLIAKAPAAGKIVKEAKGKFETTEFILSNGVKVVVKPTDFQNDEILMTAFRREGKEAYSQADAANVNVISDAVADSRLGQYKRSTIDKYLAGKKIKLNYNIDDYTTTLKGESTVKDFRDMMEMTYLTFTDLQADEEAFQADRDQSISILSTQEKNPAFIFQQRLSQARACNNPLFFNVPTSKMYQDADYAKMLQMAKKSMANAADFTFVFVGNVNIDSLKPMLEKYVASLPYAKKTSDVKVITPRPFATGVVNDHFDIKMENPSSQVFVISNGQNIPFNISNYVNANALGDVMSIVYTASLREEEGGTYSPYAFSSLSPWSGRWQMGFWFQTNRDIQNKLITRAKKELNDVIANGAKAEDFSKVREAMKKQFEIKERSNKFWNENLVNYCAGYDVITGRGEAIDAMTLDGFNAFIKKMDVNKNVLDFVMTGVK